VLAIFNSLGGGEVIAILVIALIVLGPEKLPDAIRKFGNIYGELKRMSTGFQSELRDAFDEPMRELRGTAQMMQDAVNDPIQSVTTPKKAPVVGGAAAAAAAAAASATGSDEEVQAPVDEELPTAEAPESDAAEATVEAPAGGADPVESPDEAAAPDGPAEQAD
jgi:sec-independent protein translocase protein TatB